MALTEFQTKKMTHMFKLYDVDNNGTIGESDYERRAQILAEFRGYELDSPEHKNIRQRIMKDWEQLALYVDTNADGQISLAEFLAYADYTLADDSMWNETAVETAEFIIEVCDIDGDGKISQDEYAVFFKGFNMSDADIQTAFEKLDRDNDGVISTDEFTKAYDRYGYSDNPEDPGNHMFGPLE